MGNKPQASKRHRTINKHRKQMNYLSKQYNRKSSERKAMMQRQINRLKTGEIGNIDQFIVDNTRQVRWLYNNSNRCLDVIDERKVRLIVSQLQSKIADLKQQLDEQRQKSI